MAASYEARAFGVRSAMGGGRARELCPDAIVVPPRMDAYSAASRAVFAVFRDTSPVVEGISIDEAFLDVRGWSTSPGRRRTSPRGCGAASVTGGSALTVGVARTKHLAKVASATAKPDGLLVVDDDPQSERAFLHPLAVECIWGVGPRTAERLHAIGIRTVGELAVYDLHLLTRVLGSHGARHLHALANNRDARPVRGGRRRGSIGSQSALGRRARSPAELDAVLVALVDRITRRLRTADLACRTITLRLRFTDHTRATRSRTLSRATRRTDSVLRVVRELFAQARPRIAAEGLTLLGVSLSGLRDDDGAQLELPLDGSRAGLDAAVDGVRERYGSGALRRAVVVHRDLGPGADAPRRRG